MNTMKVDVINRGGLLKVGNNAPFLEAASKLLMPPRELQEDRDRGHIGPPHTPFWNQSTRIGEIFMEVSFR